MWKGIGFQSLDGMDQSRLRGGGRQFSHLPIAILSFFLFMCRGTLQALVEASGMGKRCRHGRVKGYDNEEERMTETMRKKGRR